MSNKLIIDEINNIQNALIIPECFEPDKAKIKEALPDIIKRMMIGSCGLGDILVACEIFKDWLTIDSHDDDIRDCEHCAHCKPSENGIMGCESWGCEFKQKEDKDDK